MSIIAPTSADFLSFNVGESLADLVPMRWTCSRCHMKEAPVRGQNESQVIPAEDMVISLINKDFPIFCTIDPNPSSDRYCS